MENLMLRMQGEVQKMLFVLLACVFVFCVQLRLYRRSLQDMQSARKQAARRKHETDARNYRSFLIGVPVITLVMLVVFGIELGRYHLDRTENALLQVQGTVTYVGQQSGSRHRRPHRMILVTDGGEELALNIHKSLVDDYDVEEGMLYEVTYYPRTMTLCTAQKAD